MDTRISPRLPGGPPASPHADGLAPLVLVLLASAALLACPDKQASDRPSPGSGTPSPNRTIRPAPLASEAELLPGPRARPRGTGSGARKRPGAPLASSQTNQPAPHPVREDSALSADPLRDHDAVGITLVARWLWHDVPGPHRAPEVADGAIREASRLSDLTVSVDVSPLGRLRLVLTSRAFPLPENTEIRARNDRYGHVLIWPDGSRYRGLPPGTLRALLQERRADVLPLLPGQTRTEKPGMRLGFKTTRSVITSDLGRLDLEQAQVPGAGAGAPLLCRLLVELIGVEPSLSACTAGALPLIAEYQWAEGGKLGFIVSEVLRGQDLSFANVIVPPPKAMFKQDELPPQHSGLVASRAELFKFRSREVKSAGVRDAGVPDQGVIAVNFTEMLRYLLVDGVPVCWVRARTKQRVLGPRAGRYVVSWRDFLGTDVESPLTVELPARLVAGEEPAPESAQ